MSADDEAGDGKKGLSKEAIDRMKKEFIYGVGYGQPPKEHQFKKGKSGNPKGRPRGMAPDLSLADEPVLQAVRNAFNKTVRVRDGDTFTEVAVLDAAVQATVAAIYKGNVRAAGLLFDLKRTGDQAHAREIKERKERWTKYKDFQSQRLAEAAKEGKPAPRILPHPDDVIIDDDEGVRLIGPVDDDEQKEIDKTIAHRDALILQAAMDRRLMETSEGGDLLEGPGTADLCARLLNKILPPRLRLSDFEIEYRIDLHSRHPKRWLLKEVHTTWRRLGKRRKRGQLFPKLGDGVRRLTFGAELFNAIHDGTLDTNSEEDVLDFFHIRGMLAEPTQTG